MRQLITLYLIKQNLTQPVIDVLLFAEFGRDLLHRTKIPSNIPIIITIINIRLHKRIKLMVNFICLKMLRLSFEMLYHVLRGLNPKKIAVWILDVSDFRVYPHLKNPKYKPDLFRVRTFTWTYFYIHSTFFNTLSRKILKPFMNLYTFSQIYPCFQHSYFYLTNYLKI